jgi:enoyl-CoA hydratase
MLPAVQVEVSDGVTVVSIDRQQARNAVDGPTAKALYDAFVAFDADPTASVAILHGKHGAFCAGADLKAMGDPDLRNSLSAPMQANELGPMGPSRLLLSKPVIAAIEGHAVAGGLELALWCDLRVASQSAVLGVFCRRFGVPLIDGGTIRLPRLIGLSRALDLILTGRPVDSSEALSMGLVNRVVSDGQTLSAALELARQLQRFPQSCMRGDRLSAYEQFGLSLDEALRNEFRHGQRTLGSGETFAGAARFASGEGRHGTFS